MPEMLEAMTLETARPPGAAPSDIPPVEAGPEGKPPFDVARIQAFMQRVMGDLGGALTGLLGALGDQLGLFKDLAVRGSATSAELATRTGLNERYLREWLHAMTAAGYLTYDPANERFALPLEHAVVLAQEGGMMFLGGGFQQLLGLAGPVDTLMETFRSGAGVPQDAYNDHLLEGMARMSATWFDHLLVQQWIPAMPEVHARLEQGAHVADIGCGSGRALLRLAQAFPQSHFVGYDVFEPALARARAQAEAAGLGPHLRFERHDVTTGLPETYDLITTFDAVHDFADVQAGLRGIRQALQPDGTYVMLEMNSADRLEDNLGPMATVLYGTSVLYNLPVARTYGGEGLGTMGLPETRVRELCEEAGFGSVHRVPIMNPVNILYEIKP